MLLKIHTDIDVPSNPLHRSRELNLTLSLPFCLSLAFTVLFTLNPTTRRCFTSYSSGTSTISPPQPFYNIVVSRRTSTRLSTSLPTPIATPSSTSPFGSSTNDVNTRLCPTIQSPTCAACGGIGAKPTRITNEDDAIVVAVETALLL